MNYQNGVMPTNEWFRKIKKHIVFKDKTVVDVGSAEGVMSYLIAKAGAKWVLAVEEEQQKMNIAYILWGELPILRETAKIQQVEFKKPWDVFVLSMIIHWIGKEELLRLSKATKELVIIFREKNDGYKEPENGIWFPTLEELDSTLEGFSRKHSELLMKQDNNKKIILAIYEKDISE